MLLSALAPPVVAELVKPGDKHRDPQDTQKVRILIGPTVAAEYPDNPGSV